MSGVLKRKRNLSSMEFYAVSCKTRLVLTRYVMNEKNVPKRYRFVITMPIIESLNRLIHNIINANNIFPMNAEQLAQRKEYQRLCLVEVSYLMDMLDYMIHLFPQNRFKIANIAIALQKDYKLLKGWKNSSKIMKNTNNIAIEVDEDAETSVIVETICEDIQNFFKEKAKEKIITNKE